MRFQYTLLFVCMLLCCGVFTSAQSTHVYEDSSILYSDEQIAAPQVVEETQINTKTEVLTDEEVYEENHYYRDTNIVNNRNQLSADSIRLLKDDRQFAYAKNLDSLLKDLKKKAEEEKKRQARDASPSVTTSTDTSSPSLLENIFKSNMLQYILWGLAALFVLFIIYKLTFAEGGFKRTVKENNVKVLEEEDTSPTPGKNFDAFIAKAVSENNYRLAVRYLYLQLLQKLTAAGTIEFAVDKTNTEYLRELTGKSCKEDVAELTRYYDYVWYGEFEMNNELYKKVENKFRGLTL
jgi:hypothetical protein